MTLRPSNAGRWAHCAGSHALQTVYPDDRESPKAREGTAAHFWVTEALEGRVLPVGALAPNGHPIDVEMLEGGQVLLDDVYLELGRSSTTAALRVEQKLTAHGLIHPECEGTADVSLCDSAMRRLIVWDFKYGHRDVDPFKNDQGLCYVATVLEAYELTLADVKGWEILIRIVQPRNFRAEPVREWRMLGWQAWAEFDRLSAAADLATAPGATTLTGPWCRDCSAAHACEAAQRMGATAMDVAGSSIPAEMTPAQLGRYLYDLSVAKKRIEALTTSLEEVAISKLRTGHQVPYWALGFGEGRTRWAVPVEEVVAMGELMGVTLGKPGVITPTQAEKLGVDVSVISAYSERPRGAAKLIPMDETAAAKAFS